MIAMLYHQIPDFLISKTQLSIFSSVVNVFGGKLVEHNFTHADLICPRLPAPKVFAIKKNRQLRFGIMKSATEATAWQS